MVEKSSKLHSIRLTRGDCWLLLVKVTAGTMNRKMLSDQEDVGNTRFNKEKSTDLFKVGAKASIEKAADLLQASASLKMPHTELGNRSGGLDSSSQRLSSVKYKPI